MSNGGETLDARAHRDPVLMAALRDATITNTAVGLMADCGESTIRRWRAKNGVTTVGGAARSMAISPTRSVGRLSETDRARMHARLDVVLDELDVPPERIEGMRVSQWENVMRGTDGQPVVTQLQGIKLDIKATEQAPRWPLIDRPHMKLQVVPSGSPRSRHPKDKTVVIFPDPQIGYRQFEDGTLDPFHDEQAIDVALQVAEDLRPDGIICLGDFEDFAEFGKFLQESSFARTTQRGIDRGHEFVAQMRHACPDGELQVMEGNHDQRAEKRIRENNMAAWGLRRATDTTGWPVFSVPYLCAFDEFDCKYVGGYPAGEVWITPALRCIHGLKVRSSGSTAAAVVRDDGVSTIFGHVHRIETQYMSVRVRGGSDTRLAHTPGCLCRIDGSVPSAKSSVDLAGRPVPSAENWQQGLSVVEYREGRDSFALHSVFIDTASGYETRFNGRSYLPRRRKR